jgi:serine/threonine-protein kinase RsbW
MSNLAHIALPARLEFLDSFMEAVSRCATTQGLHDKRLAAIQLAVEEALVNVFNYAYEGGEGQVELTCRTYKGNLVVEITDSGIPFNPLAERGPDMTEDILTKKIGGLGILLIKRTMDDVCYRRVGNKNILGLIARPTPSEKGSAGPEVLAGTHR